MARPLFCLDRFDGHKWVTLYSAHHQIGPQDLKGPDGQFPGSEAPENATAFAGIPGSKARIRVDDTVVEEFDWALIPVNPLDPGSAMKWGWKSARRDYQPVSSRLAEHSESLSYLG